MPANENFKAAKSSAAANKKNHVKNWNTGIPGVNQLENWYMC